MYLFHQLISLVTGIQTYKMSPAITTKHLNRIIVNLVVLTVEDLADARDWNLDEFLLG
jgi:hypothetical protein